MFGCATRFQLRAIKALKEMLLTSFYQQYSFIIFNACKTILNVQNEDRKELCPLQIHITKDYKDIMHGDQKYLKRCPLYGFVMIRHIYFSKCLIRKDTNIFKWTCLYNVLIFHVSKLGHALACLGHITIIEARDEKPYRAFCCDSVLRPTNHHT